MDFLFAYNKLKEKLKQLELMLKTALFMLDEKDAKIEEIEIENAKLKELLLKSGAKPIKKTSQNSNLPPSKDIEKPGRRKKKKKRKRKPGGQKGHKGHHLAMSDTPDKTVDIYPELCTSCNKKLTQEQAVFIAAKQEIDIPPIKPIVTQFNKYETICSCGQCNTGQFPERLKGNVQYGPRVRSIINYALVYQYLPFKRLKDLLHVCFGLKLSEGTIFNTIQRTADKGEKLYESIKDFIAGSKVVGTDETVICVNGQKWYNWVWQNNKATFITCEDSRRKENIHKYFPNGFPEAILVSDRYSSHLYTPARGHQMCWSHLIRLIRYLMEAEDNPFLAKLLDIYKQAKHLEKLKSSLGNGSAKTRRLEKQLNDILLLDIDKDEFPETAKLQNSLINHRDKILTFIYHQDVPSHNNASELAIRNAKVKMKISGCFKSCQQHFAVIRSIVDTLIKNKLPVFDNLFNLEVGNSINFNFS